MYAAMGWFRGVIGARIWPRPLTKSCWYAGLRPPLAEGHPDSLFFGYFREWLTDREEDTAYGQGNA